MYELFQRAMHRMDIIQASEQHQLLSVSEMHSERAPDIHQAVSSTFSLTLQHVWLLKSSLYDLSNTGHTQSNHHEPYPGTVIQNINRYRQNNHTASIF